MLVFYKFHSPNNLLQWNKKGIGLAIVIAARDDTLIGNRNHPMNYVISLVKNSKNDYIS